MGYEIGLCPEPPNKTTNEEKTDEWVVDKWMGGWMDGWMDEWMDGWVEGWMMKGRSLL